MLSPTVKNGIGIVLVLSARRARIFIFRMVSIHSVILRFDLNLGNSNRAEGCGSQRCHTKGTDIAKRTCKAAEAAKQVRLFHHYNGLLVQYSSRNIPMTKTDFFDGSPGRRFVMQANQIGGF